MRCKCLLYMYYMVSFSQYYTIPNRVGHLWTLLGDFANLHGCKHKRKHRWWIRIIITKRETFGTNRHLVV